MEKDKTPLTKEERRKFRWLKESLRIYFFDTIDVDTSYKLQSDLITAFPLQPFLEQLYLSLTCNNSFS